MFNLNIPTLGIDGSGGLSTTPKTPEILNSLIAMTNPLDAYSFQGINSSNASTPSSVRNLNGVISNAQSQDSSHSSSSTSPLDSPAGTNTTPSVQQTCSQLIKAGLKLSIQSKRKLSTCESSSGSEQTNSKFARRDDDVCDDTSDDDSEHKTGNIKGLTPEDEDRRRRRRERNKIAATKCRMKKRERTQNLIKEDEQLNTQNVDLKNQVRALEMERRKLLEMLQSHTPACIHPDGCHLPSKLLQSPALKYLADLELDGGCNSSSHAGTPAGTPTHGQQPLPSPPQRTVIPPMSTIKFSRSNGFKAVSQSQPLVPQLPPQASPLVQQLPNGYCKMSPSTQELGYLNSPSQEGICLPSIQTTNNNAHQVVTAVSHSLSDYIPNCDNTGLGLALSALTPSSTPVNGDTSILLGGVPSPLSVVSTPTTASEFVKNELVDSQSPYTTAQSAERFLFESNCDSFIDIKHAVSLHPGSLYQISNNNNTVSILTNNNNNLLDFHTSLMGTAGGIGSYHDQISIKNDLLHDGDLLEQLTAEVGEFVDLDTHAFMNNSGCLA